MNNLYESLVQLGYTLRRFSIYLRFQSRRADSDKAERYVRSASVKLKKAQYNARKNHMVRNFATNEYAKKIFSLFFVKFGVLPCCG